jgi:NADH-quinone oxidoreductase subunit G
VYSGDRLLAPMIRESNGTWRESDWQEALEAAAKGLKAAQASRLGVLASASGTLEEYALLERLATALGTSNIDHRLRQQDFSADAADPAMPALGGAIAEVDSLEALLVVGSNLRREIPLLANRIRKAALSGASVWFLNPAKFDYLFPVADYLVAAPAAQLAELNALLAAAGATSVGGAAGVATDRHRAIVEKLRASSRKAIWLGALALRHPQYAALRAAAQALAAATGASLGILAEGGNAAGAHLAGMLPHRSAGSRNRTRAGLTAGAMLAAPLDAYLLWDVEPWADSLQPGALKALQGAKFVVAATPFLSEEVKSVAHVLLPIGTFAETSGTYVNLAGHWQSFAGAAQPLGQSRPGWKVLRVLGNLLGLDGFEQLSSEEVRDALRNELGTNAATLPVAATAFGASAGASGTVVDIPLYQVDSIVRRAASLQRTRDARAPRAVYGEAGA